MFFLMFLFYYLLSRVTNLCYFLMTTMKSVLFFGFDFGIATWLGLATNAKVNCQVVIKRTT